VEPRELVARVLVYLSLVVWFGFIGLFEHYNYTRPTISNRSEGRVHGQNNHGHVAYLTSQEESRLELLEFSAPAIFIVGGLIDPKRRMFQWRKPS
jgi:hypothetical protein